MHVVQSHAYTIISKYRTFETPIWVYVVSVMGGILTLILITYALYKVRDCNTMKKKIVNLKFNFFSSAFSEEKRKKN